jgi:hypothetical protein
MTPAIYLPAALAAESKPARDLTSPEIRLLLAGAAEDILRANRDGRTADVERHTQTVLMLGRALQRFEVREERARLAGGVK